MAVSFSKWSDADGGMEAGNEERPTCDLLLLCCERREGKSSLHGLHENCKALKRNGKSHGVINKMSIFLMVIAIKAAHVNACSKVGCGKNYRKGEKEGDSV